MLVTIWYLLSENRKKRFKNEVFIYEFCNVSDSELENLQRVRFWNKKRQRVRFSLKNFSTCHLLKKTMNHKSRLLVHFTPWKPQTLSFSSFCNECGFEIDIFQRVRFPMEKTQLIKFWNESFKTRQIFLMRKTFGVRFRVKKITRFQSLYWFFITCLILN